MVEERDLEWRERKGKGDGTWFQSEVDVPKL